MLLGIIHYNFVTKSKITGLMYAFTQCLHHRQDVIRGQFDKWSTVGFELRVFLPLDW